MTFLKLYIVINMLSEVVKVRMAAINFLFGIKNSGKMEYLLRAIYR